MDALVPLLLALLDALRAAASSLLPQLPQLTPAEWCVAGILAAIVLLAVISVRNALLNA